jgi:hypothetical protein
MSIFSTILDKLGIHKHDAAATTAAVPKPAAPAKPPATATPYTPGHMGTYGGPPPTGPAKPSEPAKPPTPYYTPGQSYPPPATVTPPQATPATPAPAAAPAEMPMVDVVSHLDYLAKTGPIQGLNWRMSINDLMALLGLPHTAKDIKDLAVELGCPEKEMGDSYSRNVWTHQALLKKIAENGGNIPADLLK